MLAQPIRAVSRRAVPVMRRYFGAAVPRRADILTDLYLKEVKAYKPTPVKASDSVGQVKPWILPTAPTPPSVEGSSEAEISEYAAQVVEVEGVAEIVEEEPEVEDFFVVKPLEDAHH
ncbi:ATP synthase complex subunit H-domain-containing protein [Lipomyces arxii]|uniref:ATP synthase complex subunit H-domain-containing protein n=1 Tax=Lipomyces arxii TaxID=56418 RepID=UPI0034CF2DDC